MKRGPARRFDWDEARRLRAEGWTYAALAERFGVTDQAVYFACNDGARERMHARSREFSRAICDDCGGACSHNWSCKHQRHDRVVCGPCAAIRRREETLLARMDEGGNLRCTRCGEYRPMADFQMNTGWPRSECRQCGSAARKAYREAHREADRAYQRSRRKAAA